MLQEKFRKISLFVSTSLVLFSGSSNVLAADGHPDFSGVWTTYSEPGGGGGRGSRGPVR